MKKRLQLLTVLTLGITAGGVGSMVLGQGEPVKPAFIIVSADLRADADADAMATYREKAGPVALAAGITIIARGVPTVLEGEWPSETVTIEQFTSMEALLEFWHSDEYQAAKKYREGQLDLNFIVAIEAN